jgi:hypothetical protein
MKIPQFMGLPSNDPARWNCALLCFCVIANRMIEAGTIENCKRVRDAANVDCCIVAADLEIE